MVIRLIPGFAKKLSLLAVVLVLTACAQMSSVPVSDVGTPPPPTPTETKPQPEPRPPVRQIEPTEQAQPENPAVTKLLAEGWRLHNSGEFDRSNAVAERALRIDRSEPKTFLLMASNYFSMLQLTLAEQLARQGIPLAGGDRTTSRRLQSLLNQIRSAQ